MKKVNQYYIDSETYYINGFAEYMGKNAEDEITTKEAEKVFKWYMLDYKNIKIDLRVKFWKMVFIKAMKKVYKWGYIPENF